MPNAPRADGGSPFPRFHRLARGFVICRRRRTGRRTGEFMPGRLGNDRRLLAPLISTGLAILLLGEVSVVIPLAGTAPLFVLPCSPAGWRSSAGASSWGRCSSCSACSSSPDGDGTGVVGLSVCEQLGDRGARAPHRDISRPEASIEEVGADVPENRFEVRRISRRTVCRRALA